MRKPSVRVYQETEKGRVIHSKHNSEVRGGCDQVTMRAGDLLGWLADAAAADRSWINDFADDEITISLDLFEVIQAYHRFRRSA